MTMLGGSTCRRQASTEQKALGIWVYFVERDFLREIRDRKSFQQLQKRIESDSVELGALFGCCVQDDLGAHENRGSLNAHVNHN